MSKRSDFKRRKNDFYVTPFRAVGPLVRHLPPATRYVEPCAGDGSLVAHLSRYGAVCRRWCDIDPQAPHVPQRDAMDLAPHDMLGADYIITNPPWTRSILHPMIDHFVTLVPDVWLLFDGDWMWTKQAAPIVDRLLIDIVPLPRLKWIPDSKYQAKDNCCWYRFSRNKSRPARFYPRTC